MSSVVYRIISQPDWHAIQNLEFYQPDELTSDGFIHLSYLHQVVEVANFIAAGEQNMLLLQIAGSDLQELRSEDLYGYGQDFPHLYGPLPFSAVLQVFRLEWSAGTFHLPPSPSAEQLVFDDAQRLS